MLKVRNLVILLVCFAIVLPAAQSNQDFLWQSDTGGLTNVVNDGVDIRQIPLYARIKNLSLRIPTSNPDSLVFGVRFSESFDSSPLSASKKLNVGFWIWDSTVGCIDTGVCNQVLVANAPSYWTSKYPLGPSSNTVNVYRMNLESGKTAYESEKVDSGCPAPWWIDPVPGYGVIYFQLSISCLNIPSDFYAYAFAGADIGISPIPYNFTTKTLLINPVWKLAKNSYESRGGREGLLKRLKVSNQDVLDSVENSISDIENQIQDLQGKIIKKYRLTCSMGSKTKIVSSNSKKCPRGYKLIKKTLSR